MCPPPSGNGEQQALCQMCRKAIAGRVSLLIQLSDMAQVCEICGRGPQFGHRISHAHNVTKRRWNLNLQNVRALVNGATRRIRVCTSCIRSGKVQKAA
jgi:large subunit ribosomal protein L28